MTMNRNEVTIVGAGLRGCTLARRFAKAGKRVLPLTVGGRLGSYRYLDMDRTIAEALACDI